MDQRSMAAGNARSYTVEIREELARQRLSREALAAKARISLSTIEKGLSGQRPFTLATLVRIETALGLVLRKSETILSVATPQASNAKDELGGYNRGSVAWLEGGYLALIPAFSERGSIYAYRIDIVWNEPQTCLTFRDSERIDTDYTQFGSVSVPLQSGHIYLSTNRHGQMRLIILARPVITGEMHGVLTTLQSGRGSHLAPISAPIVVCPLKPNQSPAYGLQRRSDPAFSDYRSLLRRTVTEGFLTLLSE